MIRFFIATLFLIHYLQVAAQPINTAKSIRAEGPESVPFNQDFEISYTLNFNDDSLLTFPWFVDFRTIMGPNKSRSVSWVNGVVSDSIRYTFILHAKHEGEFVISRARFEIPGLKLESNQLAIRITPAIEKTETQEEREWKDSIRKTINQHVIYKIQTDKDTVYRGEMVIATYKLDLNVTVDSLNIPEPSEFKGFLCDEIELARTRRPITIKLNNAWFSEVDICKYSLYPTAPGRSSIEPASIHVDAHIYRKTEKILDNFSYSGGETVSIPCDLKTNKAHVYVKELPQKGKPLGFKGAVGNFSLEPLSLPSKRNFQTGEKVSFTVTIAGTGNLESIEAPEIKFPSTFKVFKLQVSTMDSVTETAGLTGGRHFTYTCMANEPGDFMIGEVSFSYFDPARRSYTGLKQPGFLIKVSKP